MAWERRRRWAPRLRALAAQHVQAAPRPAEALRQPVPPQETHAVRRPARPRPERPAAALRHPARLGPRPAEPPALVALRPLGGPQAPGRPSPPVGQAPI